MEETETNFPAVLVQGLYKSYGRFGNRLQVLQNLSMTAPQGCIYGLLGPSGTGKTTLLKIIVGRLKPDKGNLTVLGNTPGVVGHGIPGPLVGYMPQETALYMELTIGETLKYFGRIHGMASSSILFRTAFLLDFLSLPGRNKKIGQLSGGQMRRVSLAVALLQEPQLLILDEPTVGVDPILRDKIWEHLLEIAQTDKKTTIIITTHYIEEARQADVVGLMRGGRLLAEDAPGKLLEIHNLPTMEEVFLRLCHQDRSHIEEDFENTDDVVTAVQINQQEPRENGSTTLVEEGLSNNPSETVAVTRCSSCHKLGKPVCSSCRQKQGYQSMSEANSSGLCCLWCPLVSVMQHIYAQIMKNLTVMLRSVGFLLFEFFLPAIQVVLFCLCIGHIPTNLKVGVVSSDLGTHVGGRFVNLSQEVIKFLDNNTLDQTFYGNLSEAMNDVRIGESWGVIYFDTNYTIALISRYFNRNNTPTSNVTLSESKIKMTMDMTNQQVAITIQQSIISAIYSFANHWFPLFGLDPGELQVPMEIEDPIYGDKEPSFTNFMAPGIIISITFFMATGLTTLAFVIEKKEGLMERSLVAGMTPFEILISHVLTQLVVMVGQVALLLLFALAVFHVPYNGPLAVVVFFCLLQGLCGMTLGIIFSAVCDREVPAIQLALGSVYPQLLLSGIIWPVEGMPPWLRQITYLLPLTYGAETMRSVLSRGWGLDHMIVWRGFLVTLGWSAGLVVIAAAIIRLKQ